MNWFNFLRHQLAHYGEEWVIDEMTDAGWSEQDAWAWVDASRAGRTRPITL